jgi:hypothetical protein
MIEEDKDGLLSDEEIATRAAAAADLAFKQICLAPLQKLKLNHPSVKISRESYVRSYPLNFHRRPMSLRK